MRLSRYFVLLGSAAVLLGATVVSGAGQTPPPPTGTHHTTRMGGMQGHPMPGSGQIVGNKKTKIYHLAGDKSTLPAEKNRVYFRTVQDAMAAGYHAAKPSKMGNSGMHHNLPHATNSTMHPMPGGGTTGTNGHLPK
jgi:hypothetical protein